MKYFFAACFIVFILVGLACSIAEAGYFYGLITYWVTHK
jgi:hypothetical protein